MGLEVIRLTEINQIEKDKKKKKKKKWKGDLNRHFFEEDIQMAKKHIKKCSTSIIVRKM